MATNPIDKHIIASILKEKDAKGGLHVSMIADKLLLLGNIEETDPEKIKKRVNAICIGEAKKQSGLITKVINPKTKRPKLGVYKFKRSKDDILTILPDPIQLTPSISAENKIKNNTTIQQTSPLNLFIGKAGECAVMSELLFRGYNVNSMLVDDGVDIVASKNNMFYLIQVKTSNIEEKGVVRFSIRTERFESFMGYNIRYILVARCIVSNIETNMYFIFNNSDIQRFVSEKLVLQTANGLNIKIRFDSLEKIPFLYHDGKESSIGFYMNNFIL